MPLDGESGATPGTPGSGLGPPPVLTLWGQVEADVSVILHDAVKLAVTGLAEVEGSPAVQLLAVGVVAYLCGPGWGRGPGFATWPRPTLSPTARMTFSPALPSPNLP